METEDCHMNPSLDNKQNMSKFKIFKKSTIGETFESLNRIIEDKKFQDSESFKQLISSDSSLSAFDESLRLSIIDRLQLESEVLKVLLSQSNSQIKRILRCNWFFENLPSEFCTLELFPHVSFSLTCKIITKLSKHLKSENEAEKYFLYVRKHYSNDRADYLLPKCSGQFILNHFGQYQPLFEYPAGGRILLSICKRHPEVGLHILTCIFNLKKNGIFGLTKMKNIYSYMAGNHPDLFAPFLRKHSAVEHEIFGKKVTKKMGAKLQENLFSDFEKTSIFKGKSLFYVLSFEDKVKFLARIVSSWNKTLSLDSWGRSMFQICEMLKMMKPSVRLEMIAATFKMLYNLNFNDYSKSWDSELLELLPLETRLPFVTKIEPFFGADRTTFLDNLNSSFSIDYPEDFYCLHEFGTAFAKLKELLRSAPQPNKRQRILCSMVKNCSINSDVKGLQEVVDFVAERHRNDDSTVLHSFVNATCDGFPWASLNPTIFEKLEDLIKFCALKGNPDPHVHKKWKENHIYYLMENGVDVSAHVKDFLDLIIEACYHCFLENYKCQHSKRLLLAIGELAVKWIRDSTFEQRKDTLLLCVVHTCKEFSNAHKGSRIMREVPGLEELLIEKAKTKFNDLGAEKWSIEVWEKYYGDVFSARYEPKCLLHVLKRRPDLIESHFEGLLGCITKYYTKSFKKLYNFIVKVTSFFDKTEKLKELLLNKFKNGETTENRVEALLLYSQVSTIEEFTEAVQMYLPKQEKVEGGSDPVFGKIQLSIPRLIKNILPHSKNFDLILKFFMGDFLKNVMPSLYSCCHHTRVDVVIPFLKERLDSLPRRISYQKDIIRLIAKLSTRDERTLFCLKCWDEHRHYSIRTILFVFISEQFIERPTRESFQALEKCILESEHLYIDRRPSFQKVPNEFLENYVSALWRFSERQTPAFRNEFQQSILWNFVNDKISLLSSGFCEKLIKNNLFNPEPRIDVEEFTALYLTTEPTAMEARVLMVLDLIREAKPSHQSVSGFLRILLRRSESARYPGLLKVVLENWPEFPVGVLYEERLLFTYNSLHQKVLQEGLSANVPEEFAKELQKFFSSIDNLRDLVVIYAEALSSFFQVFGVLESILTVKALIAGSRDRTTAVLGILALPQSIISLRKAGLVFDESIVKSKAALDELERVLESYGDEVVEIFAKRKFSS